MTDPEVERSPRSMSLLRWSLANSTGLAATYLLVSVVVELARRLAHARWAERLSLGMESVPARTLEALGLLDPLRRHWMAGELSDLGARVVYGLTSVVLIYVLGLLVGPPMWLLARMLERRSPPAP
jgi:hypothetical protein